MRIYLDNKSVYLKNAASLNTSISMGTGTHNVTVQAWDSNGKVYITSVHVTVGSSSGGGGGTTTSGGTSISNIDQMTGWSNCGGCAGPGGKGPNTPRSLTQFRSSPSMDGKSSEFWIGGSNPYSAALWWKQLGAKPSATHFVYDLYFYMNNPGVSQALEFDVNQSVNGKKYIMGTECNFKGTHQWDIWSHTKHWVGSGVACNAFSAYKWHHLTWEFARSGSNVQFVSVSIDGVKHYINRSYPAQAASAKELNVAFQMDGNSSQTDYSTWVDKISLRYW